MNLRQVASPFGLKVDSRYQIWYKTRCLLFKQCSLFSQEKQLEKFSVFSMNDYLGLFIRTVKEGLPCCIFYERLFRVIYKNCEGNIAMLGGGLGVYHIIHAA